VGARLGKGESMGRSHSCNSLGRKEEYIPRSVGGGKEEDTRREAESIFLLVAPRNT